MNKPIERQHEGAYKIGNKTYNFKDVNNNLLVRVGGGYKAADEFFQQFTHQEERFSPSNKRLNPSKS